MVKRIQKEAEIHGVNVTVRIDLLMARSVGIIKKYSPIPVPGKAQPVSSKDKNNVVQELCKWLKDPEMYVRYHEEYNHNKRITISEWRIAQNVAERDVIFLMPLQAPSILKRTIGDLTHHSHVRLEIHPAPRSPVGFN